jgi:hypothetical protein
MKKTIFIILSFIIFSFAWFVQEGIYIGINVLVYGRGTGGITGLGVIPSIWTSFKFVKWIWKKYFYPKT